MAYAMTKQGSLDNCVTYEFICDTVTDMNAIEDRYRTIGTVAIVLQGNNGLEVYIAGSNKQWNTLSSIGGSSGGSSNEETALPTVPSTNGTYILQATVTNGVPTYSWINMSNSNLLTLDEPTV